MEGTMLEYYQDQIESRTKILEDLNHIYNSTHKEIRKHTTMLNYYKKQKDQES